MARFPSKLSLNFTVQSLRDLDEIWDWNVKEHGQRHAAGYTSFLRTETRKLSATRNPGREVPDKPGFRYVTIKVRRSGFGHVAVFWVEEDTIHVFRYFHTSQDWENKIASDQS